MKRLLIVLGALLALCACTAKPSASPSTAPVVPTSSASNSGSSARSTAVEPTLAVPAPITCAATNLTLALGEPDGAAGHAYYPLTFTNKASFSCLLGGHPGVSFVTGADSHQVGNSATMDTTKPVKKLTLQPGGSATATVGVTDYANYDPATCQPVAVTGLRVYPPGETHSLIVPAPMTTCSTTTQTLLTITAVFA